MCDTSVPGYITTQFIRVLSVVFSLAGFAFSISGVTVVVTRWGAPVIRRSILYVLLCFSIRLAGPVYCLGPWCFCLTGDAVRAELRADTPLYLGREVAGQPHHMLVVQVSVLPPRVGVATCALGNSWLGVRVRIPRPPGPQSIYLLADLGQLEAAPAFSLGFLLWL